LPASIILYIVYFQTGQLAGRLDCQTKDVNDSVNDFLDRDRGRHQYAVVPLSSLADSESTVDLLADSFSRKAPLDVLLGLGKSDIIPFARSLRKAAMKVYTCFIMD
jgi:hypothetical protein